MTDPRVALRSAVEVLAAEEIPYMVIGGIANLVWGEVRTTTDVDFTVDIEGIGIEAFLEVARRCGRPLADDPHELAETGRLVPVRTPDRVRIDFVLATLPFELEAIRRARSVSVGNVEVKVIAPEDLVIEKSVATRARDHDDIVGILKRQGDKLDLDRLDSTIEGLAADMAEPGIAERWREAKRAAGLVG